MLHFSEKCGFEKNTKSAIIYMWKTIIDFYTVYSCFTCGSYRSLWTTFYYIDYIGFARFLQVSQGISCKICHFRV